MTVPTGLKRRSLLTFLATSGFAAAAPAFAEKALPEVHVFKNPHCGCCGAWIDHLKNSGFAVKVTETTDGPGTRKRLGMPDALASCHTATVGGYVLEGHVPASDVKRLLSTKPAALGLAVPGMPLGSPGMEVGGHSDPFEVLLVRKDGKHSTFAKYPKA